MIPFKQIATLAVALLCAASAQAQAYKVMQIHRTDGTVQTIPTAEIDSVTFATVQPVELFNQCELGGNVWNIASLTEVTSTPVPYPHPTLPTCDAAYISVVAASTRKHTTSHTIPEFPSQCLCTLFHILRQPFLTSSLCY